MTHADLTSAIEEAARGIPDGATVWVHESTCGGWPRTCSYVALAVGSAVLHQPGECAGCDGRRAVDAPPPGS